MSRREVKARYYSLTNSYLSEGREKLTEDNRGERRQLGACEPARRRLRPNSARARWPSFCPGTAAVSASDLFDFIHRDVRLCVHQSCLATLCTQNLSTSGPSQYVRSHGRDICAPIQSFSLQFVRRWGTSMGLWGAGTGILALYVSVSSP